MVQTNFVDVMDELRKQVQDLKQVVAELMVSKQQLQVSGQTSDHDLLLTKLFSDNLDNLTEIYPDSAGSPELRDLHTTDIQLPFATANSNALSQASVANSSSLITSSSMH